MSKITDWWRSYLARERYKYWYRESMKAAALSARKRKLKRELQKLKHPSYEPSPEIIEALNKTPQP